MKKVTTRFINFYRTSILFDDIDSKTVDVFLEPSDALFSNSHEYAFRFHTREDIQDGDTVYYGEVKPFGPRYLRSTCIVETAEQVKQNPKATQTLLDNLEMYEQARFVWTSKGSVYLFYDDDVLLLE